MNTRRTEREDEMERITRTGVRVKLKTKSWGLVGFCGFGLGILWVRGEFGCENRGFVKPQGQNRRARPPEARAANRRAWSDLCGGIHEEKFSGVLDVDALESLDVAVRKPVSSSVHARARTRLRCPRCLVIVLLEQERRARARLIDVVGRRAVRHGAGVLRVGVRQAVSHRLELVGREARLVAQDRVVGRARRVQERSVRLAVLVKLEGRRDGPLSTAIPA